MQQRGSSGREYTGDAERDEQAVEADDEAVVAVDAIHQRFAQAAQCDQLEQILRRYGYIGDLVPSLIPASGCIGLSMPLPQRENGRRAFGLRFCNVEC